MKANFVVLLAAAAVAGCVSAPQKPAEPMRVVDTKPPRCESQRECEVMWLEAQQQLQMVSGMRLRMVTDSRMETFAANGYSRLTGVVQKYPVGDSAYELRITLQCYHNVDCRDLPAISTNLFNTTVGSPRR